MKEQKKIIKKLIAQTYQRFSKDYVEHSKNFLTASAAENFMRVLRIIFFCSFCIRKSILDCQIEKPEVLCIFCF